MVATPVEQRDPDLANAMYDAVLTQILTDAPDAPAGGLLAATVTFRAIAPELVTLRPAERQLLDDWLARVLTDLDSRPLA